MQKAEKKTDFPKGEKNVGKQTSLDAVYHTVSPSISKSHPGRPGPWPIQVPVPSTAWKSLQRTAHLSPFQTPQLSHYEMKSLGNVVLCVSITLLWGRQKDLTEGISSHLEGMGEVQEELVLPPPPTPRDSAPSEGGLRRGTHLLSPLASAHYSPAPSSCTPRASLSWAPSLSPFGDPSCWTHSLSPGLPAGLLLSGRLIQCTCFPSLLTQQPTQSLKTPICESKWPFKEC